MQLPPLRILKFPCDFVNYEGKEMIPMYENTFSRMECRIDDGRGSLIPWMRLECFNILHHDIFSCDIRSKRCFFLPMRIRCHHTQNSSNPRFLQRNRIQSKQTLINNHPRFRGTYLPRNKFGMISCRKVKLSNS